MSRYYFAPDDVLVLSEVIAMLEARIKEVGEDFIVKKGFKSSDSYRGYYEQLAFSSSKNMSLGKMLEVAKNADGAEYHGYKGGLFRMALDAPCWIADHGHCIIDDEDSDGLTEKRFNQMLKNN